MKMNNVEKFLKKNGFVLESRDVLQGDADLSAIDGIDVFKDEWSRNTEKLIIQYDEFEVLSIRYINGKIDKIIKSEKDLKDIIQGYVHFEKRMTEKEKSVIDKIQDLIDDTDDLSQISFDMDESDINSADDVFEYIEDKINEIEVIYYNNAMKILSETDPSLQISMGYADDLGYRCKNINSELLATILCQELAREELYKIRDDIEEVVDEWLESDEEDE